ncbi:MAG: Phosphate transport regulator (distant homolog of PhoU), partial [uncultured Nocardioides sp.]
AFEVPPCRRVVLRPVHRPRQPPRHRGGTAGPDARRRRGARGDRHPDARGRARRRRDHPRHRQAGQQHLRHPVRPRGHLLPRLRPRRHHGHDGRGRRPDPAVRGQGAARRAVQPGRGHPALRRADRRGHAATEVDAGPRGVLDRDQPPRERRRQELPPDPGQPLQRRLQGHRGAQAQGHRHLARGCDRCVREGRQHGGADRGQGVL